MHRARSTIMVVLAINLCLGTWISHPVSGGTPVGQNHLLATCRIPTKRQTQGYR